MNCFDEGQSEYIWNLVKDNSTLLNIVFSGTHMGLYVSILYLGHYCWFVAKPYFSGSAPLECHFHPSTCVARGFLSNLKGKCSLTYYGSDSAVTMAAASSSGEPCLRSAVSPFGCPILIGGSQHSALIPTCNAQKYSWDQLCARTIYDTY